MNAPGLLLLLVSSVLAAYCLNPANVLSETISRLLGWLISVVVIFIAGRLLGHRGIPGPLGRALAFAHSAYFILLLAFVPNLGSTAKFLTVLFAFMAYWMGSAISLKLSGWRVLLLPLLVLAVIAISLFFIPAILGGIEFTLQSLAAAFGVVATP